MFRNKRNKNSKTESSSNRQSLPLTRYYRTSDRNKKSTKRPAKNKNTSLKFTSQFIKRLPQKISVIAIITLLLINLTIPDLKVKIVNQTQSNNYRPLSEYKSEISKILNESIYNKTKFTLSATSIERQIIEEFPEVVAATVVVPLAGRVLQVGLEVDTPLLRLKRQTAQQGIVGETGKLLTLTDTNLVLESFSVLPSMIVLPNVNFSAGDQVLTSGESGLINLLITEFDGSQTHRKPLTKILFKVDKREMQVSFEGVKYFAKLTPEREARAQVGALIATLKDLEEQKATPSEYVDVRVEGRVFVK